MNQKNIHIFFIAIVSIIVFESTIFILLLTRYKKLQQQLYQTLDARKKYLELMDEIEFRIKKKILLAE